VKRYLTGFYEDGRIYSENQIPTPSGTLSLIPTDRNQVVDVKHAKTSGERVMGERGMKVLMIEDNPGDARLISEMLVGSRGLDFDIKCEENLSTALEGMGDNEVDLILLDLGLPDSQGLDTLIKTQEKAPQVPIIVLTGLEDEELAVKAVRQGAQDYLVKGQVYGDFLAQAMRYAIERKRAEDNIRGLNRLHESIVSTIPSSLLILDDNLDVIMANRRYLENQEVSLEEVKGKNIADVFPKSILFEQGLLERIINVARYGGRDEIPGVKHTSRDHPDKFLNVNICGINTPGDKTGVLLVLDDVTEQRSLREQLNQSQKLEAVGRLAGGVAHDFNNELTIIMGLSDLILTGLNDNDPLRKDMSEISDAAERSSALIRQLLAFSRKQFLEPRILDLNSVLANLEKMLRRLIGEDIELLITLEPELGRVKADPGQIEQVIVNLAVNARDAMPQGGKLTIRTGNVHLDESFVARHVGSRPGPHVNISVTDTGGGMDEETRTHIFEPFFTTKEPGKGTGLGLSTVYGIVKQSGGSIWVESEPGKGTIFDIYLPRIEAELDELPDKRVSKPESLQGSETILLVEDEELLRKMLHHALTRYGYKVLEAKSPKDAILICEQNTVPIHMLLTDVVMPGISGLELADQLKSLRPKIKTLFMSGYTNDTIVNHGVLHPEMAFIHKPFTFNGMALKVRQILDAPHLSDTE